MIARAAEGSVRDALSLLDQAIAHGGGTATAESVRAMLGLADRLQVLALFRALMAGEVKKALDLLQEQYTLGADPAVILKDLVETTHWVTRIKTTGEAGVDVLISEPEKEQGEALANELSLADLTRAWQILLKGFGETQTAPSPIRSAEMVIIRLAHAARLPDPAKLVKTLSQEKDCAGESSASTPDAATAEPEAPKAAAPIAAPVAPPRAETTSKSTISKSEGNVVALAQETAGHDELPIPMPQSFKELVALFEKKHEGVIGKYLFDDVRLVSFKPGAVSFKPVGNIPATLPSRAKNLLETWTGQTWQITLVNDEGETPLRTQEQALNKKLDERARNNPLVQKVLAAFPGAEVSKIRPLSEGDVSKDDETGLPGPGFQ